MKIMVCGKGGCGKTVVSALIAKELVNRGKRVLVIDTDESNICAHRYLGLETPKSLVNWFGGKSSIILKLRNVSPCDVPLFFEEKLFIDDLVTEYAVGRDNLWLIAIGKINHFREGCACPLNILARELLCSLKLRKDEFVIVDSDAGIEHFGRGVEAGCDLILIVVEPSFESIQLSRKIARLAKEARKRVFTLANKVDTETRDLVEADAYLPFKRELYLACLRGEEIPVINEVKAVVDRLLQVQKLYSK